MKSSYALIALCVSALFLAAPSDNTATSSGESCPATAMCVIKGGTPPGKDDGFVIGEAWGGFPVQFAVVTRKQYQFIGYYNASRRLVIARRDTRNNRLVSVTLPSALRWDSHNGIAMDVDAVGQVHVFANMHDSPLTYFRTSKPLDITTLRRVPTLTGVAENSMTYPTLFEGPGEDLILSYRNGKSASGDLMLKSYNPKTGKWSDLTPKGFIVGEGARSAYPTDIIKGPNGRYHLAWVWRSALDAAANLDPSYAYSNDLKVWRAADGTPLKLPITLDTADIVDHVPPGGGILNGLLAIGFDAEKRVVVSYHRYDEDNHSQIFNARFEDGKWVTRPVSRWNFKWDFGGKGSFAFAIGVEPVTLENGQLTQSYRFPSGLGRWLVSDATLQQIGQLPPLTLPPVLTKVRSQLPQMQTKIVKERGSSGRAMLRWESRTWNRDKPIAPPYPTSLLEVYTNG